MRREKRHRSARTPRPPAPPSERREFDLRRRLQDAEDRNNVLRSALAEVVEWYDTFDQLDGRWLTDRDFDRYRRLAKVLFRPTARGVG